MKRRAIAAVWITGATVPLLLATVFLVGCCVLPFHQVAHKLMPVCDLAADLMRGVYSSAHDAHDATPPAREKQEAGKRLATEVPNVFRLAVASADERRLAPQAARAYRSFITLGAVRCDTDVGLNVLVGTFLI